MWFLLGLAFAQDDTLTRPPPVGGPSVVMGRPMSLVEGDVRPESVLLWQGFEHYWQRKVLGLWYVPHRVSRFESGVAALTPRPGQPTQAEFTFAQSTGVDGDYMNPVGFVAQVSGPDLILRTGVAKVSAVDQVVGVVPRAMHPFHDLIVVEVPPSDTPRVAVALLQGLSFTSRCVEAEDGCNSNGIWPYRFAVDLAPCADLGDRLVCPVSIEVGRAWTPGHGGVKGIEEKPLNTRMSLDVEVAWAIVGGSAEDVLAHRVPFENALPTNRHILFEEQIAPIRGLPTGYPEAVVGLTGLGFTFFPTGRNQGDAQRGRYIGGWGLQVRTADYRPDEGALDIGHAGGIWLPKTVAGTGVSIEVGMAVLQFADPAVDVVEAVRADGQLCSNSHDAPPFSAWEKCDAVLGEERTEQRVRVTIP